MREEEFLLREATWVHARSKRGPGLSPGFTMRPLFRRPSSESGLLKPISSPLCAVLLKNQNSATSPKRTLRERQGPSASFIPIRLFVCFNIKISYMQDLFIKLLKLKRFSCLEGIERGCLTPSLFNEGQSHKNLHK